MPPRPRPPSVIALCAVGIILAAMRLFGGPCSLLMYLTPLGDPNPIVVMTRQDGLLMTWTMASGVMSFALGAMLLAGSIGAIGLRPWARKTMVVYGAASLGSGSLTLLMKTAVVAPRLLAMSSDLGNAALRNGIEGSSFASIFGGLLGLLYSLAALVVMTRPAVREAFEPGASGPVG